MERDVSDARDRELGMGRKISRRDFLDGAAIGAGALLAGGWLAACTPGGSPTAGGGSGASRLVTPQLSQYPPAATGLAGQTDAAYAIPHMLRDGAFWDAAGSPESTGETYDLVVVGGGISGLSSAYYYSLRNPDARILILDALVDFGGHAHRNEFTGVAGRKNGLLLGYGGAESIEAPHRYSSQAKSLLEGIGVNVERLGDYYDTHFYKYNSVVTYRGDIWGRDYTAVRMWNGTTAEEVKDAPMAEQAKRDLVMLDDAPDWMPGLSDSQKKERLSKITYLQFLTDVAKVHPDAAKYLQTHSADDWGYGINCQGAIDVWPYKAPGFDGMQLDRSEPSKYNSPSVKNLWGDEEPYHYHFPEGNAGISRLLVRNLIPGFKDAVVGRQVIGPWQMENEWGLIGGNIFHGELSTNQLFHMRPAPSYADYRTPIKGLYQASSATHAGGGVTGLPGHHAVREIFKDRKRRKSWRRPLLSALRVPPHRGACPAGPLGSIWAPE